MPVNKVKIPTKDGRKRQFKVNYKNEFNNNKQYNSKKYATRAEAKEAKF